MWTRRAFLPTLALLPSAVGAAARDAEGFEPLFNGRDLTGWHVENGPSTAFFADQGDLVVHRGANFPTWLRSDREYENFEFRCEFFMKGWINSGILLRAARYGNPTDTGLQLNLFHKLDKTPLKESCGSIFPVLAPSKGDAHKTGEWNTLRIVADWPRLQVWINDTPVQDVDLATHPELRWRLRRGYLGIESLSYPIRLRNLRIRELPSKDRWQTLYAAPQDWDKWFLAEGKEETWERLGPVLRCDGLGYLATKQQYRDFEFQSYIRHITHCNGGVLFRADRDPKSERRYEIQIHDVWGATYPTGSLYHFERSRYPRVRPEEWFLFQLAVKDDWCLVRIDGETVMEHKGLQNLEPGHILLQAHRNGFWIEYQQMLVRPL